MGRSVMNGGTEETKRGRKLRKEQVVAHQVLGKDLVAPRARSVEGLESRGRVHRSRPSRSEYPVFTPSHTESQFHGSNDNYLGRRHQDMESSSPWNEEGNDARSSIGNRPRSSLRSPHAVPINGLSPKIAQRLGVSPKSAISSKSPKDPPVTPVIMMPAGKQLSSPQSTKSSKSHQYPPVSPHSTFLGKACSPHLNGVSPQLSESNKSPKDPPMFPSSSWSGKEQSGFGFMKRSRRPTLTALPSIKLDAQNAMMGFSEDLQSRRRGNKVPTNSTPPPTWTGCSGSKSMVAPALERDRSTTGSFTDSPEMSQTMQTKEQSKERPATPQSSSLLSFMSWGKKKIVLADHSHDNVKIGKVDMETFKVLDYTIKDLQSKLEKANSKRATAVHEVRALQKAIEIMGERLKQLQQYCKDLEHQMSESRDTETQQEQASYVSNGVRQDSTGRLPNFQANRRFSHPEATSQLFSKTLEEAKSCLGHLLDVIRHHIRESGGSSTHMMSSLLEQHKVAKSVSHLPRSVLLLYFEAFLSQVMFESFENVTFEPNGATTILDPDAFRRACFQAYQDLKKQEWTAMQKSLDTTQGGFVSASFHNFFIGRMRLVCTQLGKLGETVIPLSLASTFFEAVKSVWLLHHLAFSFDPPVTIFRVVTAADFDPRYMEQRTTFEEDPVRSKISIMVTPGFVLNRQILKSIVFCSNKYQ